MPTNDKEYAKDYRRKNRKEIVKYNRAYVDSHRELYRKATRKWYWNNKEKARENYRKNSEGLKLYIFGRYCKGAILKCAHCSVVDIDVLCLDHINHCGIVRRRIQGVGSNLYRWIIRHDFPPEFQILCANCNMKKEKIRCREEGKMTQNTAQQGKLI